MAAVAKALGDPVRLQLVDVLRKHAGKVCVCELVPVVRPLTATVSHHLKVLREAGLVGSERQGLWAYYYVNPDAVKELQMAVLRPHLRSPLPTSSARSPSTGRCSASNRARYDRLREVRGRRPGTQLQPQRGRARRRARAFNHAGIQVASTDDVLRARARLVEAA